MIELSYVSLFSGIEAFSVAASRIEGVRWNPVFFSEIDPFPCAVLAHHFPQVPNLGDICKIRIDHDANTATNGTTTVALPGAGIDILAGGSPCQDCSIAGKRAGMAEGSGTRSSLAFEYARLVEELRPRIILWENVPGVLSSNRGLDFAAFLRSLVERGYSVAYRVLDAQCTVVDGFPRAVPQRRKRVWLVGCAGTDESVPAQILFERPGVLGDTPPRREAGQGFAAPLGYCATGDDRVVGGAGFDLQAFGKYGDGGGASTLKSRDWKDATDLAVQTTPMSPGASAPQTARGRTDRTSGSSCACDVNCLTPEQPQAHKVYGVDGAMPTLPAQSSGGQNQQSVPVSNSNGEDVMPPITASEYKGVQAVCVGFSHVASGMMLDSQPSPTSVPLKRSPGGEGAVCLGVSFDGRKDAPVIPECAHTECVGTNPGFKNGVATMLKVRCGKDTYTKPDGSIGTAGKGPLASEESAFILAATQDQTLIQQVNTILEDNHANATKTNPGEILRVLREALGEKAFEEWAARIAAPLWTKEVLRHEVHGEGIRREACEAELGQVNGALALSEDGSAGTLRDVRQAECDGCSPQGRELPQQHPGESDSPMPQLSHQGSPQAEGVQDLWRTDEGARVLREALSALQEIRRSASMETQPAHAFNLTHIVRRLTPIECERLMALPDNYTRIPYRGKPADQCPDSPRYKALGNSWATNCAEWILRRIVAAVRIGLIPEEETPCQ